MLYSCSLKSIKSYTSVLPPPKDGGLPSIFTAPSSAFDNVPSYDPDEVLADANADADAVASCCTSANWLIAFVVTRLFCTSCEKISAVGVIPRPSSGTGCMCAATGGTSAAPMDPGDPAAAPSIASVLQISNVNMNAFRLLL